MANASSGRCCRWRSCTRRLYVSWRFGSCWNRRIFLEDSMSFYGFLCDSMPTPFVGSRRFLLYDHEGLFVSCFQKILCFYHVYNEPESPVIRELTHFHRLHQHNPQRQNYGNWPTAIDSERFIATAQRHITTGPQRPKYIYQPTAPSHSNKRAT